MGKRRVLPRAHLFLSAGLLATAVGALGAAQAPSPIGPPTDISTLKNFLPLGPPAGLKPSAVPDLAGAWVRGGPLQSISNSDVGAELRGKEPDVPYQPWALKRMLSEVPPTGPFAEPHRTTDPWTIYCEPNGPVRVYAHPGRTEFVQLPDRVLMLHEIMQQFRIVRLNSTHPPHRRPGSIMVGRLHRLVRERRYARHRYHWDQRPCVAVATGASVDRETAPHRAVQTGGCQDARLRCDRRRSGCLHQALLVAPQLAPVDCAVHAESVELLSARQHDVHRPSPEGCGDASEIA